MRSYFPLSIPLSPHGTSWFPTRTLPEPHQNHTRDKAEAYQNRSRTLPELGQNLTRIQPEPYLNLIISEAYQNPTRTSPEAHKSSAPWVPLGPPASPWLGPPGSPCEHNPNLSHLSACHDGRALCATMAHCHCILDATVVRWQAMEAL